MKYDTKQIENAYTILHEWLKPSDVVYTSLTKVSRSGMHRRIRCYIARDDEIIDITYYVACILGYAMNDDGLSVSGCGMDMGFSVVHNLSASLFPDGFTCTGKTCRSNDHSNGDRNYKPHHHKSGDYALTHRWM